MEILRIFKFPMQKRVVDQVARKAGVGIDGVDPLAAPRNGYERGARMSRRWQMRLC